MSDKQFEFTGYTSSLACGHQHSLDKRFDFLLFVNERLVDWPGMKRAVTSSNEMFLMCHVLPFFFGQLVMPGKLVDVNVHPTISPVLFQNEEEIAGKIVSALETELKKCSYEKSFSISVIQSFPQMTIRICLTIHF